MKELARVIRIVLQEKRDVVLSVVFGYLAGLTAVGLFAANGYLISQAALQPPLYVLIGMVAVVKIGSILRATSRYGERYYSHRATFTMLSNMRVHFYEQLEQMLPHQIGQFRTGDLLARIVGDVESLQNLFLRVVYPPIIMITVFMSTILFVSFYTMEVVLILTVGLLLTGVLIPAWFATRQRVLSNGVLEARAALSTEVTEWLQGFREWKLHQQLAEKERELMNASNTYITEQERSGRRANLNYSVNIAASFLIFWIVIAVSSYLVASDQLDGLFLAMIVMISLTLFDHSAPMAVLPVYYEESERAAKRLHAVTASEEGEEKPLIRVQKPSITFQHVSFTFPGERRAVIRDATLHIPARSKVAIVGPSGSGKSTLLKLLLQLCKAQKGDISIDGVPIHKLDAEQVWAETKVVLQDSHFFAGTIADNLLLEHGMSDEEIEQLLIDVQLSHFSPSDEVLENGTNLSGGEKQRLAMARAIAKSGSLWLLDEPASALDGYTAEQLYDVLYSRAKDDTLLLISHQLSGLERMDQIIVMEEGTIIEQGTYAELMESKGYFYELKQLECNLIQE